MNPNDSEPEFPLLFAGQTPNLRKVRLRCVPSLGSNRFGSLTHLELRGWEKQGSESLRFHELLDVVKGNPSLQDLRLSYIDPWIDVIDDPETFEDPEAELVQMDHIRRMRLTGCTPGQLIILFRFLRLPEGLMLAVSDLRVDEFDIPEYTLFSNTALLRNLACIHALTIQSAQCTTGVGLSGSFLLESLHGDDLAFSYIYDLDLLPFAKKIQELWIEEDANPHQCWYSLFLSLPRLQKLSLSKRNSRHILNALGRITFPLRYMQPRLPCEHLTSLWIDRDPAMSLQPSSSHYDLLQCVELRHTKGHPIHDVHVRPRKDVGTSAWPPVLLQEV